MSDAFSQLLSERGYLVAEWAMGTNLFKSCLENGDAPELWNVDNPDSIDSVHQELLCGGRHSCLTISIGGKPER